MSDDLVKRLGRRWDWSDDEATIDAKIDERAEAKARIEELEAKLEKAVAALEGVRAFVRDLAPYADQGHALVPALEKACAILAELKGNDHD